MCPHTTEWKLADRKAAKKKGRKEERRKEMNNTSLQVNSTNRCNLERWLKSRGRMRPN